MGATEANVTDVAIEIGTFLLEWISGHVLESDLPMKPYVDRMREQAEGSGEKAPKQAEGTQEPASNQAESTQELSP